MWFSFSSGKYIQRTSDYKEIENSIKEQTIVQANCLLKEAGYTLRFRSDKNKELVLRIKAGSLPLPTMEQDEKMVAKRYTF